MTTAAVEKPAPEEGSPGAPAPERRAGNPPRDPDLLMVAFWLLWVCLGAVFVLAADLAWWVVGFIMVVEVACVTLLLREVAQMLARPDVRPRAGR